MKKALIGVAATTAMALAPMASAFAWTGTATGTGACNSTDGSYQITWKITNTYKTDNEDQNSEQMYLLKVTDNHGNDLTKDFNSPLSYNESSTYLQSVDGTKSSQNMLTANVAWEHSYKQYDEDSHKWVPIMKTDDTKVLTAQQNNDTACKQPTPPVTSVTPPVTGGRGGDTSAVTTTTPVPATTTAAPTAQVVTTPTGAVNAGSAAVAPAGIVAGIGALVAALGLGLRRLGRSV